MNIKKKNTNNLVLLLVQSFRKYKYFCGFYLICLVLMYPFYYLINDHNVKYYDFSYDLSTTSPLIIREGKPTLSLNRLNVSINNELYNQIYSLSLKENINLKLNCSLSEMGNSCILRIKNANYQLVSLINEKIISAIRTVDVGYKDKLNESISRFQEDIKLLLSSSDLINKMFDDRNINISESADLGSILEILVTNSLRVNELNSEINLLRSEVLEVENFVGKIEEQLNLQKLKIVNDKAFANYSVKKHLLTTLVGSVLLVFSFLILIRD